MKIAEDDCSDGKIADDTCSDRKIAYDLLLYVRNVLNSLAKLSSTQILLNLG